MFTRKDDHWLREIRRRAVEPLGPIESWLSQLVQARADVRELILLVDDLDEQLADAEIRFSANK